MSIFTQMAAAPANTAVILLNTLVFLWFLVRVPRPSFEHVSISYRSVVLEKQYYRVVTATFSHLDFMHIIFNMGSLFGVSALEAGLGSAWYAETTLLLLVAKAVTWLGVTHVLVTRFGRVAMADASAVGYSGVLFGWFTLFSLLQPSFRIALPGGFSIPIALAPFGQLLFTQLILPRASFMGHLAGILGGYVVGLGGLNWLRGYWAVTVAGWWGVLCLLSLRANSGLPAWAARWVYVSPEYCATTMLAALADEAGGSFGNSVRRMMVDGVLRVSRPVEDVSFDVGVVHVAHVRPTAPNRGTDRADPSRSSSAAAPMRPSGAGRRQAGDAHRLPQDVAEEEEEEEEGEEGQGEGGDDERRRLI